MAISRSTAFVVIAVFVCICILTSQATLAQSDWPQWRGPKMDGTSEQIDLPVKWSMEDNIAWKADLPAWSGSSPVIVGDKIFLMSPTVATPKGEGDEKTNQTSERDDAERDSAKRREGRPGNRRGGRRRGGRGGSMRGPATPGGKEVMLMCLSRSDGSLLWERQVEANNRQHGKQNSTSPSPVTDGQHVWTLTGNGQMTAFDLQGNEQWSLNIQEKYGDFGLGWGYASSPTLHAGKLIVQVLHGQRTDEPSYVVAFDAATGDELWKQERPTDAPRESPDAYTTPMILEHDKKTLVIVSGGDYVTAHDFETGKEVWRSGGLNPDKAGNYRIVGSPLIAGDLVVATSRVKPIIAIRAGGAGDVTASHIAWKYEGQGGPDVPSAVSDGQRVYLVNDRSGLVTCLDLKSGEVVWGPERVQEGTVSASPLLAGGKLYITNEQGATTIIKAGQEFEVLASNELDGSYTLSSMAVSGKQLFVRTAKALYCIGKEE